MTRWDFSSIPLDNHPYDVGLANHNIIQLLGFDCLYDCICNHIGNHICGTCLGVGNDDVGMWNFMMKEGVLDHDN